MTITIPTTTAGETRLPRSLPSWMPRPIRSRRGRPVEGTKGAADQLIIALGSAGAFQAAVDCLRAWLGRDRDRRIDLRWEENGVERSVTLTGEAVDAETVREIAKAAVARAGGSQWPAGTVPS
jgi:Effector Associated Constant Component 1